MKSKLTRLMLAAALFCFVLVSCKKNDAVSSNSQTKPKLMQTTSLVDAGLNDLDALVADITSENAVAVSGDNSNVVTSGQVSNSTAALACATVTYDPDRKTYPRTQTTDYGSVGCTDEFGITRTGQQISTIMGDWITGQKGDIIRTSTWQNFTVNGLAMTGETTVKITEAYDTATRSVTLHLLNKRTYVDPNSGYGADYTARLDMVLTNYVGPKNNVPVFQVTGTQDGEEFQINAPGDTTRTATYSSVIDVNNPVITKNNCSFRTKGIVNIAINMHGSTDTHTEVLDYGDNKCDNAATLTVDANPPQAVDLPFVFFVNGIIP